MEKRKLTNEEINLILEELKIKNPIEYKTSVHNHILLKLKHQLSKIELYPKMFDAFKQNIIKEFHTSRITPGENVGILTAQSIGEKQTQMSIGYDEMVYVYMNNNFKNIKIGKLIDDYFTSNIDNVVHVDDYSWLISTLKDNIYAPSVDIYGNVKLSKITMFSRHSPNGDLLHVKTQSGKQFQCTYSHSLLTLDSKSNTIVPIKGSDISVNTLIPILNTCPNLTLKLNKNMSNDTIKLLAMYFNFGKCLDDKLIFSFDNNFDLEFIIKYADTYNIKYIVQSDIIIFEKCHITDIIKNSCSIPLYILNNGTRVDIEQFIEELSIKCKSNKNNIASKIYYKTSLYLSDFELILKLYYPHVNYKIDYNNDTIYILGKKGVSKQIQQNIYWDKISFLENIPENVYTNVYSNYVYDFSVDQNETFMLSNGIFVHNTLNSIIGSEIIGYIDSNSRYIIESIGSFIDKCMEMSKSDIKYYPENNTQYLELTKPCKILSVTPHGEIVWKNIDAITRHTVPHDSLIKIVTESGRSVTATKHKSFMVRIDNILQQKTVGDVRVGDLVPIIHKSPHLQLLDQRCPFDKYPMNWEFGFFIGSFHLYGCLNKNTSTVIIQTCKQRYQAMIMDFLKKSRFNYFDNFLGVYIYSKQLVSYLENIDPYFVHISPIEFIRGYISSLFFEQYTLKSHDSLFLKRISDLLTRFGIIAKFKNNNTIKIVNKHDFMKIIVHNIPIDEYDVNDEIPGVNIRSLNGTYSRKYLKHVFKDDLYNPVIYNTIHQHVFYDRIVSVEPIHKYDDYVYDLTIADTKTFSLLDGLLCYDTFHTTGLTVKTVVTGVPRFLELMNTTREPKSANCQIVIKKTNDINSILSIRNMIGDKLRHLTLTKLMYEYEIIKYSDIKHNWWLSDCTFLQDNDEVLRVYLSPKLIYEYRCCLTSIVNKINEVFTDIQAVCSSLNECIVDVIITDKTNIILPEQKVCYITDENKFYVFMEEIVLPKLDKFTISGIEKINDFIITSQKTGEEWLITTEGSNLKGIFELDLFDTKTTLSNNMWEIYNTLGIEATREFLIREFTDVISSDGTFINKCHIYLLVDSMTCKGDITSISRYSLRSKSSVLSRSSFEESIENFLKSGIFSEIDKMVSISSNIMTGKLSKMGTGMCDILIGKDSFNISSIPVIKDTITEKSPYDINNKYDNITDSIFTTLPLVFN